MATHYQKRNARRFHLAFAISLLSCCAAGNNTLSVSGQHSRVSKPEISEKRSRKKEMYVPCDTKVRAAEVLVKFTKPVPALTLQTLSDQLAKGRDFWFKQVGAGENVYLIHIEGLKVTELVSIFTALKLRRASVMVEEDFAVDDVEPNFIFDRDEAFGSLTQNNVPNDLIPQEQWGLLDSSTGKGGTSAVSAWKSSQGSREIVVGIVDTGISYLHQDLAKNVWHAPWDFKVRLAGQDIICLKGSHGFSARSMTCNPIDAESHGTEVSGITGAEGDNAIGLVGVNWRVSMMGLQWQDKTGGDYPEILNAINFAVEVKKQPGLANLRVLNNSYGFYTLPGPGCRPRLLAEKIQEATDLGILFVSSAGDERQNTDADPHYPSGLGLPGIISVAATTKTDCLYSHSSFGQTSVHLGAPGARIRSTSSSNGYSFGAGTSYSAPFVSGAAALILSKPGSPCKNLTPVQLKECILSTADEVPSLKAYLPRGRRLNVNRAITDCEKYLH